MYDSNILYYDIEEPQSGISLVTHQEETCGYSQLLHHITPKWHLF